MSRALVLIFLTLPLLAAPGRRATDGWFAVSSDYGWRSVTVRPENNMSVAVRPDPGAHTSLTFTAWGRMEFSQAPDPSVYGMPSLFWTPDPVRRQSHPDLLGGAYQNTPHDFDTSGAVEEPGIAWTPYGDPLTHFSWPYGVYCIAGESQRPLAVDAGGAQFVVSNKFNVNFKPTAPSGLTITGEGLANFMVGRARVGRYRMFNGWVAADGQQAGASSASNEWVFVGFRLDATGRAEIRVGNYGHKTLAVSTNSAATRLQAPLDGDGEYMFFMMTQGSLEEARWVRARVHHGWLSDEELDAEWRRGRVAIEKRGVGLWLTR